MSVETFNWLMVSGDKDELFKFKKMAKSAGAPLLLNNLVPIPEELKGVISPNIVNASLQKKYGAENQSDWCHKNWGAFCDVDMVKLYAIKENELKYSFYTISSPPIPWIEKASKVFPKLKFELIYHNSNWEIRGKAIAENGSITWDNCHELNSDEEYYGVIGLEAKDSMCVKFLEDGKSFVLNRSDQGSNHYEILYKVEYIGRTTLLSLPGDLSDILQDLKIKGKTFTIVRETVEGVDCIGFREEKETNTLADFKAVYQNNMVVDCSGYDYSRKL